MAASQDAEAVMLDFVEPARAGRRRLRGGRQTQLDDPQAGARKLTQRHGGLIGTSAERVESHLGTASDGEL